MAKAAGVKIIPVSIGNLHRWQTDTPTSPFTPLYFFNSSIITTLTPTTPFTKSNSVLCLPVLSLLCSVICSLHTIRVILFYCYYSCFRIFLIFFSFCLFLSLFTSDFQSTLLKFSFIFIFVQKYHEYHADGCRQVHCCHLLLSDTSMLKSIQPSRLKMFH